MKVSYNNLKVASSELGGELGESLAPIFFEISQKIKSTTKWYKSLDENTKKLITKTGLFVTVAGPAVIIISKIGKATSDVIKISGKFIKFLTGSKIESEGATKGLNLFGGALKHLGNPSKHMKRLGATQEHICYTKTL